MKVSRHGYYRWQYHLYHRERFRKKFFWILQTHEKLLYFVYTRDGVNSFGFEDISKKNCRYPKWNRYLTLCGDLIVMKIYYRGVWKENDESSTVILLCFEIMSSIYTPTMYVRTEFTSGTKTCRGQCRGRGSTENILGRCEDSCAQNEGAVDRREEEKFVWWRDYLKTLMSRIVIICHLVRIR